MLLAAFAVTPSFAASRIKDLSMLEGQRDNQLVGYGLVVGLAGQGDSQQARYTVQSIANMLRRFGVDVPTDTLISTNVAAVMVTVNIPAFQRPGSRLDVIVSSIGDAQSLQGGVLLQTPLLGADDQVYAVAQGSIIVGGMAATGENATVQRNHPTVGRVTEGAIVEREIRTSVINNGHIAFLLRNPDFATAVRMAEAVNKFFPKSTVAISPHSVRVRIPEQFLGSETSFIAAVESVTVRPDTPARVVMNERTGTIVATADVRLSEAAVSHGNVTVTVARTPVVSQPNPFGEGQTVADAITDLELNEKTGGFIRLPEAPTLQDLTNSLNALGVSPRDMMSILQTLKTAGALHAELIVE